jgi:protein-disulfide isomerase
VAEDSGRMKGFYVLLAGVAVVGGGAFWYGSQKSPAPPAPNASLPAAAADGFAGFTLGSDAAPVEVTEFSDFECPFCASFATVQMPVIREQVIAAGKLRWRFRDFPLPTHKYSRYAAMAAQCAGEQSKFWEMHDQLFANHQWAQTGKNPRSLFRDFARAIALDLGKYDACMDGQRYAARIEASVQAGEALGVRGTPSFFVNGRPFTGRATSDDFKSLVDSVTKKHK